MMIKNSQTSQEIKKGDIILFESKPNQKYPKYFYLICLDVDESMIKYCSSHNNKNQQTTKSHIQAWIDSEIHDFWREKFWLIKGLE